MDQLMLQETIERIQWLEHCLDELQKAAKADPALIRESGRLKEYFQNLIQYIESGQWLRDYELDEKGYLPHNLKRGILAQDMLYNFLEEHRDEFT